MIASVPDVVLAAPLAFLVGVGVGLFLSSYFVIVRRGRDQ